MKLYAYHVPDIPKHEGYLKIGETHRSIDRRISQQTGQANIEKVPEWQGAIATERTGIDRLFRHFLRDKYGFHIQPNISGHGDSEWINCTVEGIKEAFPKFKELFFQEQKERQAVTDRFYKEIRNWFYWTMQENKNIDGDYALRLVIRLLFCFFLREKDGLVPKELLDANIVQHLKSDEYSYFGGILRNLFFHCLNTPGRREYENEKLLADKNIKSWFFSIPFLNGGLFDEYDKDDIPIGNDYFFSDKRTRTLTELGERCEVYGIITILSKYQYKLTLDDLLEQTEYKTVDPEFIGKVFESLLSCIDSDSKESRQRVTGSYYTPREIVDYMVNEALDAYLENKTLAEPQSLDCAKVGNRPPGGCIGDSRSGTTSDSETAIADDAARRSATYLLQCKILDPACGSGAFPCEAMNIIMHRIEEEKRENGQPKLSPQERYYLKLDIIRNVLYGVDIQPMAVQITVLRFFLSLMQDIVPDKKQNREKTNYNIKPLPNLETKFVCADTLIGIKLDYHASLGGKAITQATIDNLRETRRQYFMSSDPREKVRLREYDVKLRKSLAKAIEGGIDASASGKERFDWNPYDQSLCASFFDSIWMFGIDSFDIVIGNPPYDALYNSHPQRAKIDCCHHHYKTMRGGTPNLYKLFFEKGLALIKDNGLLVYITPYNYLTSADSIKLREILLNETTIIEIVDYEESQNVFASATQAVATIITRKQPTKDYRFEYRKLGKTYTLKSKEINHDPRLMFKGTNRVIKKMNQWKQTFDNFAEGYMGEIHVSKHRMFFVPKQRDGDLPLIRGRQVGCYQMVSEPEEFCPTKISARLHHKTRRIVFQEIANASQHRRIKATILENVLCGHTVNYMFSKHKDIPLEALLGLLNSWLVNYYFKFYNQTNHVPIGEIKKIPVPDCLVSTSKRLAKLVTRRLNGEMVDNKIDAMVYELYGLTDEEIALVENQ